MTNVNRNDFSRAMRAALMGPEAALSIQKHGFWVKRSTISDDGTHLTVTGKLSHTRSWADDDQIYFTAKINKQGTGTPQMDVKVNGSVMKDVYTLGVKFLVKLITEALKEKADDIGTSAHALSIQLGIPRPRNAEDLLTNRQIQDWIIKQNSSLLDGGWGGVASFLIASISYYAVLKHSLEVQPQVVL